MFNLVVQMPWPCIGPNHELLICDYKHQCVFVLDSVLNLLNTLGIIGGGQLTHSNGVAIDA